MSQATNLRRTLHLQAQIPTLSRKENGKLAVEKTIAVTIMIMTTTIATSEAGKRIARRGHQARTPTKRYPSRSRKIRNKKIPSSVRLNRSDGYATAGLD